MPTIHAIVLTRSWVWVRIISDIRAKQTQQKPAPQQKPHESPPSKQHFVRRTGRFSRR
jgi:hypothetical protein